MTNDVLAEDGLTNKEPIVGVQSASDTNIKTDSTVEGTGPDEIMPEIKIEESKIPEVESVPATDSTTEKEDTTEEGSTDNVESSTEE